MPQVKPRHLWQSNPHNHKTRIWQTVNNHKIKIKDLKGSMGRMAVAEAEQPLKMTNSREFLSLVNKRITKSSIGQCLPFMSEPLKRIPSFSELCLRATSRSRHTILPMSYCHQISVFARKTCPLVYETLAALAISTRCCKFTTRCLTLWRQSLSSATLTLLQPKTSPRKTLKCPKIFQ